VLQTSDINYHYVAVVSYFVCVCVCVKKSVGVDFLSDLYIVVFVG